MRTHSGWPQLGPLCRKDPPDLLDSMHLPEQGWVPGPSSSPGRSRDHHTVQGPGPMCRGRAIRSQPAPSRAMQPLPVVWGARQPHLEPKPREVSGAGRGRKITEVARATGQGPGGPTSEGPAGAAGKSSDPALGGHVQNNWPHHPVRTQRAHVGLSAGVLPSRLQKVTAISGTAWQQDAAPRRPQRASARGAAEAQRGRSVSPKHKVEELAVPPKAPRSCRGSLHY